MKIIKLLFIFILLAYQSKAQTPNPSFVNQGTICVGSTITFTNTSTGATGYSWNCPGGNPSTSTLTNPSITYNSVGNYNVLLTAYNSTGTLTTYHTNGVRVRKVVSSMNSVNASCASCMDGQASVIASGGMEPYHYKWLPGNIDNDTLKNLSPACYTVCIIDTIGCMDTNEVCIALVSGIKKSALNREPFLVYPNPTKNYVIIEYKETVFNYFIYDNLGRLVASNKKNSDKAKINLTEFTSGVYVIEVEIGNDKLRKKLIID